MFWLWMALTGCVTPHQQCAEDQIGDNGFAQGAGRPLVASRHADLAGDHAPCKQEMIRRRSSRLRECPHPSIS
jgi:hypothetical protein